MSCPTDAPLRERLASLPADNPSIPWELYLVLPTLIGATLLIPFLYHRAWTSAWHIYALFTQRTLEPTPPPGCSMYGAPGERNPSDGAEAEADPAGGNRIKALFIYPIKSCHPVEVHSAEITPTGFKYDRAFAFAQWTTPTPQAGADLTTPTTASTSPFTDDQADDQFQPPPASGHWAFLTQRSHPRLARVRCEIWLPDSTLKYHSPTDVPLLIIAFPFTPDGLRGTLASLFEKLRRRDKGAEPMLTFHVPLTPSEEDYPAARLRIWRDYPHALDVGRAMSPDVKSKLAYALGVSNDISLFAVHPARSRVLYKCAPGPEVLGRQAAVGFADSYPIHLQNLTSIADTEARVPPGRRYTPDARRFRANIYISGPAPYAEDAWTRVSIAGLPLHVSALTPRCSLPSTHPDSGEKALNEPFGTMVKYRVVDEGSKGPCLGVHLVPGKGAVGGEVRVGDKLEVVGEGGHVYVADPGRGAWRPVV
ncbi:MOSC-domain-containing protein [Trichodelitschia bisporula]|uniref:MOSC-domain-containing protein n=1 Tax=Trichodelitschia bisporula TaxID=703511 RepID=A0A6G1I548_9PEZI|nr:MOSC-domain-containing protein [Trichodelitschia bisporula]